jgi:hypothetical protein
LRAGVEIGEVAAAAAGDADLFRQPRGMVDQDDFLAALAGNRGAHHAGGAGADYCNIKLLGHECEKMRKIVRIDVGSCRELAINLQ